MTSDQMSAPDAGPDAAPDAIAEEAARRLVRLQSDAVTEGERRDTDAWLAARPEHRAAFDGLRALWGSLDALQELRGPPTDKIVATPLRRRSAGRLAPVGLLAASLALAALAGPTMLGRLRSDHSTAVGERRTVVLDDGSQIQLNTDSAVAVDFSGSTRRVTLRRGEAFFTVAPDREHPFEVRAMGAVTRVVGTRFAVRRMENATRVSVEEGTVEVQCPDGAAGPGDGLRLTAGEVARYQPDRCPVREAGVSVARATAWRDGHVVFDDRTLREVVDELNRYRSGPILLLGEDLGLRRITGVFDIRDPERALSAIEQVLPVRIRRIAGYVAIVTRREG
ncbi:FecR family protein [Azospirillum picis]|uniref:Transmembrane sensor n=1 Tax=Azospirillum picis TaxID=488438 RepID=A0ABU0MN95_9PROT|nr:FecR family protein [Azospirillum picis]MBP2300750.1 transmembrane sensor [Azospirillum picis]MDQ0534719.1 transmembrane sensor [Azospirillum picis]